jgi:hypothetical protein
MVMVFPSGLVALARPVGATRLPAVQGRAGQGRAEITGVAGLPTAP